MIIPANRLLIWVGLLVPFTLLSAAMPETMTLTLGVAGFLTLTAALDAALAFGRIKGLRLNAPELVRLTKDREGLIELRVENEGVKTKRLRVGLALPTEIKTPDPILTVDLPREATSSLISWPCRPVKRGRYFLEAYYLEVASPLGFWAVRQKGGLDTEVRVYPNLFMEQKNLAALFLNRGGIGIHAQRMIGKGRDFEKLREYLPGDSYEDIHWKATAKRGHPVTKMFQIERTQEVYVIMDASRLSARHPEGKNDNGEEVSTSILERYVTSALVVGLAAQRQGDHFGLLTFSDRVQRFLRAKNGKAHYDACREALYTLQPQRVSPDYAEVFTFIVSRLRKRALLMFLTNMDDPVLAESFVKNIHIISRRHLVLVSMIRPPGIRPLFSSELVESSDDLYRELGGHFVWSSLAEAEKVLRQRNVGFHMLENEKLSADLVTQYLGVKQRQAL